MYFPKDTYIDTIEAEFEAAFSALCHKYDRLKAEAEALLEPAEDLSSIEVAPKPVQKAVPAEIMEPATENIAEAASSVMKGDYRSAEEAFSVAMALGVPGSAIMNVAEKALDTLKATSQRPNVQIRPIERRPASR